MTKQRAREIVSSAIRRSQMYNEVAVLEYDPALEAELRSRCYDWADCAGFHDYWGGRGPSEWRVQLNDQDLWDGLKD